MVYPRPRSSWPPATLLLGLAGGATVLDGEPVFALEVDGVCGSDRGWERPGVAEDLVGWGPAPSAAVTEAGACVGAAWGVAGTVDACRRRPEVTDVDEEG